jgi:hypothetical protein
LKWTLKQVQGDGFFYNQSYHHTPRHPELVSGSIGRFIQFKKLRLRSTPSLGTLHLLRKQERICPAHLSCEVRLRKTQALPRVQANRPKHLACELGKGIRTFAHRSHRIFYQIGQDEILITRILHHAMDVKRVLKGAAR